MSIKRKRYFRIGKEWQFVEEEPIYYKHLESGLIFGAVGAFNYLDEMATHFVNNALQQLDKLELPLGFELYEDTYLEWYAYDHDQQVYFEREEDIEKFLPLLVEKDYFKITVTQGRYDRMIEDKRSARSEGTY